jgi:hypothetical protein
MHVSRVRASAPEPTLRMRVWTGALFFVSYAFYAQRIKELNAQGSYPERRRATTWFKSTALGNKCAMITKKLRFTTGLLASALLWGGCSHAQTALSPIVGSWEVNGSPPSSDANSPQFTTLKFKSDGSLIASYVATNRTLSHIGQSSPQTKQEEDSYTVGEGSTLHIVEGSRALDYTYDIRDDKLLLTPKDETNAVVYVRVPKP